MPALRQSNRDNIRSKVEITILFSLSIFSLGYINGNQQVAGLNSHGLVQVATDFQ